MKIQQKILIFIVILLLGITTFGYIFVYQPYIRIKSKANILIASAKQMKDIFSKSDIDLLNGKLKEFTGQYRDFEKESKSVYWATFIPYVADFKKAVEAGDYLIKAAQESVTAIMPYADLIGFKKGTASFIERSAEDRLQTAVLTLEKVLGKVDVISNNIEQAEIRIKAIDANRYPKEFNKKEIRSKIINAQEQFNGLASLFVDAKPLLKKIPDIFGKSEKKTYLVLFQNDKELRATGGFLTAYAIFKVEKGKIKIEKSEDIYSLDNSISIHPIAPREILTYHKGVSQFQIRDSNLSPDLPTSIDLFNSLYKKSSSKIDYDGIITIDSKILVDMLTIFGDTEVDGVRFSAKIDKRCDCAQVLYQLFDMVDRPVPYLRENRKGILGNLMYALFYKAIGFSPSKYWGKLAQDMFKNLNEKHIQLYFTNAELQKSIEKLNYAGRVREYGKDYLYINNVNFAGAKSNLFVSVSVDSKTKKNDNGKIRREVTVEYRNPYPHSDCNLERGGLCLNATLRNWIRVYVPKGSELVNFQGSEKQVQTYDELGKSVFEGYLEVPTQGKATATIVYTLPSTINTNNYSILVQKQPGTDDQKLKVQLDGRSLFNGILETDKEIK